MRVRYRILSCGTLFRVQYSCGFGWVDHKVQVDGEWVTVLFHSFEEAKKAVVTGKCCPSWKIVEEGDERSPEKTPDFPDQEVEGRVQNKATA